MNRSEAYRRRYQSQAKRRGGRRAAPDPAGRTLTVRLVICGVIFVLLVAVKLLFPGAVGALTKSVGTLLGRDADFRAAFAAVGRAVSGEAAVGDSLQDAYTAVFNPQSPEEEDGADAARDAGADAVSDGADPSARLMSLTAPALAKPDLSAVRETVVDTDAPAADPAGDAGAVSLDYTYQAPPDNASMEQRNLGFAHCTPVLGGMNSDFGWREHPVVGGNKFHYGLDIGAAEGTDILAFADGEVYATGESSTLGNYIMLQHANGYITLYAHCSRVTATGGSVAMGEKIAEVGSTGQVTGPHLHFELHDGELYLNPIYYVQLG